MSNSLKALVVVLAIGLAVFVAVKPYCLRFIRAEDYDRRRNVWAALTIVAFLSPSFWLFVLFAAPIVIWASARDENPLGLYLVLLHVVPPVKFFIPFPGLNQLFDLTNYRLLALLVLVPLAFRRPASESGTAALPDPRTDGIRRAASLMLLAFGLLSIGTQLPHHSVTHSIRQTFLFFLDTWLVFYCVSVFCNTRRLMLNTMASFGVVCAVYAPVAVFETIRSWLLYFEMGLRWGDPNPFAWLYRGSRLRAQVSAGHALMLGYMTALAFGFWLYLRQAAGASRTVQWAGIALLWAGLLASISRGPWLTAIAIFLLFAVLAAERAGQLVKTLALFAVAAGAVLISPLGDNILNLLPFVGQVDAENVVYRQRLAAATWSLIQMKPWFGDPFALRFLEDLRQGQGIIDLVNTFAAIALFHGLVGLALFMGVFLTGLAAASPVMRRIRGVDPDYAKLGACLVASMLGTFLFMATCSFGTGLAQMSWVLAGLLVAYARVGRSMLKTA